MRLRSSAILYILFLFGCVSKQEEDIKEVKDLISNYSDCSIHENFNGLLDLLYPTTFKKYSKDEIISSLRNGYHNEDYNMNIKKIVVDSISDMIREGNNKYVFIKGHTSASFTLADTINKSNFQELFDSHCKDFKKTFGDSNVACIYSDKKYDVTNYESFFAIYSSRYKKWLLLGTNDQAVTEESIPNSIRKKFGF